MLFFAIDKVNWDTTHFEVVTPDGKVTAVKPKEPQTASAGIVEVRHGKSVVATEAGSIAFTGANGQAIQVDAGCTLTSNGSGYQVVNLTTGQIALYDVAGALTGTRVATAAELQSSSTIFAGLVQLNETLIASGVITPEVALAIRGTLTSVNQELASLGLSPINTESVGSLPSSSGGGGFSGFAGPLGSFGSGGSGAANPANVAGNVKSPSR